LRKSHLQRVHPRNASAASQKQDRQRKLGGPPVRKALVIFVALILFAPVAYAGLYQAALIVA
jgi:hypothetical protein